MSDLTVLDLASKLKIQPEKTINCLKIPLGEKVSRGKLLAVKKSFLGQKRKVFSPCDGVLEKLEEATGRLVIKKLKKKKRSLAGRERAITGIFGFGRGKGKFSYLGEKLFLKDLKPGVAGKIIGGQELKDKGVIFKAAALGAEGVIAAVIKKEWREEWAKMKKGVDFAFLSLGAKKRNLLLSLEGKKIICDGENCRLIVSQ